jgi:uncharacterized protein YndB with AHSA1/START domain
MDFKTNYVKDAANKKMTVTRNFDAPVDQVWTAWTDSKVLEQWWAPEPFKARTKSMNFTEGGYWHYAMVGPDGMEIWAKIGYKKIVPQKYFTARDSFCDAEGVTNNDFPNMDWVNTFSKAGDATTVVVEITFDSEADMEKIMEMGFKEGFEMAHGNLDKVLKKMVAA